MADKVFYMETGSTDPAYNLAFEEFVLTHRTEGDYLLLWQNRPSVIIGSNQNTEAEINRTFVECHGIRVVRRTTGGGAVYHDLGNLNYSFITDRGEDLSAARFTAPVVAALRAMGVEAEASGRNDILAEGRKVSGTARRIVGERVLHHGTLLFDADTAMAQGALQVDPEKFRDKSTKSVRSRITNLRPLLREDMDLPAFWQALQRQLMGDGFVEEHLLAEELQAVEQLQHEKYERWEWNFGSSPQFEVRNKRRFTAGSLEVRCHVEKGCIEEIVFYGDFLASRPLDDACAALRGVQLRREALEERLAGLPINEMFGGITTEEIVETILTAGD